MNLIVNHSSMWPIYDQIADQVKDQIMHGKLAAGEALPSVRTLAKELKVSALTVKKAYDTLEAEGFIHTVHGKGSFVAFADQSLMLEENFSVPGQHGKIVDALEEVAEPVAPEPGHDLATTASIRVS